MQVGSIPSKDKGIGTSGGVRFPDGHCELQRTRFARSGVIQQNLARQLADAHQFTPAESVEAR